MTIGRHLFLTLSLALLGAPLQADLSHLALEKIAEGLDFPVALANSGDGRLFVALINGKILIVENGQVFPEPFLDLAGRVHPAANKGLYGLAFPPDFAEHRVFFVSYTAPDLAYTISRFSLGEDPNRIDPDTERVLLRIPKETARHNGGQLAFGPDGYLYVTSGDGSTNVPDPHCASLSLAGLEGKILRLDVLRHVGDPNADVAPYYVVPEDNPLIDQGAPEVWALGLRNPWRISFDRETGDLWIGDVGEVEWEEIDRQPASSPGGENYGWKVMEGGACFSDSCAGAPACNSSALTLPALEYAHEEGRCSVTGGHVYRGTQIPDLVGRYLYGDFCSGEIFAARIDDLSVEKLPVLLPGLVSFGESADGEIYALDDTSLYRLIDSGVTPTCVEDAFTLCLNGGRFRVSAEWRTADSAGRARARSFDDDVGTFWFFSPNNVELFVKVLDACFEPFQHYWVFAAGLTNVGVEITVVDTLTDTEKVYESDPGGAFTPVQDTRAFATCP